MITSKDLASVKAFYENEYLITVSKLKHIKKMLKKFDNVSDVNVSSTEKTAPKDAAAPRKRGPKPGSRRKVAGKTTTAVKKEKVAVKKAKTATAGTKKRPYVKWSTEIVTLLKNEKRPMGVKDIVDICLKNKGITGQVEVSKASHSIRNLTYRLRDEKALQEMKVKGTKGVLFGLTGWFRNGVLQDKFKQKK